MRILIVGAGKLGYKLAESLVHEENDITVLDINEQALNRASSNLDVLAMKGNGAQIHLLEQLNVKRMDFVACVTGDDDTNLLISILVKKLGGNKVIARVRNPEYAKQIDFLREKLEVDYVINPDLETARNISKYLLKGRGVYMEPFAGGKVGMVEFPVDSIPELVGTTLRETNIFEGILVTAILREGEVIIPYGATQLDAKDILYLLGKREVLTEFAKDLSDPNKRQIMKNVLIIGGGNAAYHLAIRLAQAGVATKIIEHDEERCEYLAERLQNVLIIHGDGTDSELLQEENLSEMDALVSITGFDEENLLLALLGKQQGVGKVVAKVSRSNFIPTIEQLGIERAVNPVLISAGEILRFIQGGNVASLSLLFDGQAEVVEIIVTEEAAIVGKPLMDLKIPQGIIIGAIVHDGQVVIPDGGSLIHAGDRVVVFCLASQVAALEKLFYRKKGGFLRELWHGNKGTRKSPAD